MKKVYTTTMINGYTPTWVDKQIIKACLPRKEFFHGPNRFKIHARREAVLHWYG
ncbi:hypothetical protein FAM8374_02941 [Lacticaseibacillus paracasei]|mgnify:CR=1 FL=1|jgi:hypothetical protein|nr:hypothetical protein FAM8374_02941 [Lacticaseibacillus paracasei]